MHVTVHVLDLSDCVNLNIMTMFIMIFHIRSIKRSVNIYSIILDAIFVLIFDHKMTNSVATCFGLQRRIF